MSNKFAYDLCVIGGGVNGTGIARDAAGRGLKVLLLEKGDLAQATSSASTKLIHGGLRYLECFEFKLVREALVERENLINLAPHIIWPLTFVLPHAYTIRPYWLIRLGLYLYDVLSFTGCASKFPKSRGFKLKDHKYGEPLKDDYFFGASYSDGWVQDSRLSVLNAMDAKARGADIRTRTACTKIQSDKGGWKITFQQNSDPADNTTAKLIVNAAGPWVRELLDQNNLSQQKTPSIRLVKGSHIIVDKLYEGDQAYILQQPDKRIIFTVPYEGKFTLIGTTDVDFQGDKDSLSIDKTEIDYLLNAVNIYFKKQLQPQHIKKSYCGVRPLLGDEHDSAKEVTRDYKIHYDEIDNSPLISIFGGKITTFRKLSERATKKVCRILDHKAKKWTHLAPLPGGDIVAGDFQRFYSEQRIRWENEDPDLLLRYARNYGTRMMSILQAPRGVDYGDGIYEREIRYLIEHEFARTAEDILWRRSKLDLHISEETRKKLENDVPRLFKEITGYDY